jgi:hypothetical protein
MPRATAHSTEGQKVTIETVDQVRLRNLKFLLEQFKDEIRSQYPEHPERGMLKLFAERVGISVINFRQIMSGHKLAGPNIRDRIEDALSLPRGWLDSDHSQDQLAKDDDAKAFSDSVMALYNQAPEATRIAMFKVMSALVTNKPLEALVGEQGKRRK